MISVAARFVQKVSGSGLVVFKIPVPREEILELTLEGDTLQVDGSMAILRTGDVQFNVEKASTTLVRAVTSGEGLLQTFRGRGKVWVAPTQPIYQRIGTPGQGV
jgi:uncharacterized protein (AIM24 family)